MSFPLVGNLSKNPEGLRTSRNDKERYECRLTNDRLSKAKTLDFQVP